eukprot:CAMPEP_0179333698 /NCGR_PEP_ID=MMETSP0797-20121207/65496_1 /TAXON_ID=47934 /ORGANISM="Dinophysis acuminata, Strain DAEP01" /LENGTH=171 /DNA_ID=CAMNT_0021046831 /DNA_START=168 /DNA_END=684 /DNA_ORIENTATION=-
MHFARDCANCWASSLFSASNTAHLERSSLTSVLSHPPGLTTLHWEQKVLASIAGFCDGGKPSPNAALLADWLLRFGVSGGGICTEAVPLLHGAINSVLSAVGTPFGMGSMSGTHAEKNDLQAAVEWRPDGPIQPRDDDIEHQGFQLARGEQVPAAVLHPLLAALGARRIHS